MLDPSTHIMTPARSGLLAATHSPPPPPSDQSPMHCRYTALTTLPQITHLCTFWATEQS